MLILSVIIGSLYAPVKLLELLLRIDIIEHLETVAYTVNVPKFHKRTLAFSLTFGLASYHMVMKLYIKHIKSLDPKVSLQPTNIVG